MTANADVLNTTAQGQLRALVDRIERQMENIAEEQGFLKEIYAEAKGGGYDVKILRKVVRLRKMDAAKRQEEEAITDLYLAALGELPLFETRSAPAAQDEISVSISTADGAISTPPVPLSVFTAAVDVVAGRKPRKAAAHV